MSNCSVACVSQDHKSFGECMRSKGLQIGDLGRGVKKVTDLRLNTYAKAKSLGLQPQGTQLRQSESTLKAAGAFLR